MSLSAASHKPISAPRRVAVALWMVACAAGCTEPTSKVTPGRNVLLVTLGSTRADRLGCYGYEKANTPHLDALAKEGVRFENAYATSGLGPMSQASILTGKNTTSHGLRVLSGNPGHRLSRSIPSLPQILGNRGWRTAGFVSSYFAGNAYGLGRGYQQFRGTEADAPDSQLAPTSVPSTGGLVDARENKFQRRSDATTDEALTWLEEHGELGPWHLWVQYADLQDLALVPPLMTATAAGLSYDVDPQDLAARELLYDFELAFMDAQLGRLIDYLKSTGQYENTILVILADHGQGLTDGQQNHGWSLHRLLYNWSVRVPMIIKLPQFPPGIVVPDLVRSTDVLPTLLEHVELLPPTKLDGRSLLPILRRELDEPRIAFADALILEEARGPNRPLPERQLDNLFLVMNQRWKLIYHERQPNNSELYDMLHDPAELSNVYADEPELAAGLLRTLEERGAFDRKTQAAAGPAPDGVALEALGYGSLRAAEQEN